MASVTVRIWVARPYHLLDGGILTTLDMTRQSRALAHLPDPTTCPP